MFSNQPIKTLPESSKYIIESFSWGQSSLKKRQRINSQRWQYIQGNKRVQGRLIGGCMEVLSMINATSIWPSNINWDDVILFLETSEEKQPPSQLKYFLRNLGAQGIIERIRGILFARPGGEFFHYQKQEQQAWIKQYKEFDKILLQVVNEYNRPDLCIVSHLDFGHTVPQLILPIGMLTEINPVQKTIKFLEGAVK